jgi:hypothetical protein
MRLYDIITTSGSASGTSARSEEIRLLAACLRRVEPDALRTAVALRQGRIGISPAMLRAAMLQLAALAATLTLAEVDAALDRIATLVRARRWIAVACSASSWRARHKTSRTSCCVRYCAGCARGAVEGLMVKAVARAAAVLVDELFRMAAGA